MDSWSSETNLAILQIRELRSRKVKTTGLHSSSSIRISPNKMSRYTTLPSAQTPPLLLPTLPHLSLSPTQLHSAQPHSPNLILFLFPKEVRGDMRRDYPTSVFLKSLLRKSSSLERLCTPHPFRKVWTTRSGQCGKARGPTGKPIILK